MIKRCLLFVLSFALLSTSLSIVFSNNTFAASIYDGYYKSVDSLLLERNGFGSTCSEVDISTNWASFITDESKWQSGTPYNFTAAKESFQNKERWGVSIQLYKSGSQFEKTAFIFWTEDDSLRLNWDSVEEAIHAESNTGFTVHQAQIYQSYGSCDPKLQYYNPGAKYKMSSKNWNSEGSSVANFLIYSDYLNVPTDYEGTPIQEEFQPKIGFFPNFTFQSSYKDFKAQFKSYDPKEADQPIFIRWRLYDQNLITPETPQGTPVCDITLHYTDEFNNEQCKSQLSYDYFTSDNYYLIDAQIDPVLYFEKYPNAFPDQDIGDIDFLHTAYRVQLGPTAQPTTGNTESCEAGAGSDAWSVVCSGEESIYEDCDPIDIPCHFRNFWKGFTSFLSFMFVPDFTLISKRYNDVMGEFTRKMGLLSETFTIATNFFNNLQSIISNSNSVCNFNFGDTFGKPFKLNMCAYEQQFPTTFLVVRSLIISLTGYILISSAFSAYRRIV